LWISKLPMPYLFTCTPMTIGEKKPLVENHQVHTSYIVYCPGS
jgi:hypothetical protein